jgi:5-methylcytosine-specific restriction endonuclease McrA
MQKYKRCSKCGQQKSHDQFFKFARAKDGLAAWCKKCQKDYLAVYRSLNKDKIKSYKSNFVSNNPDYQKNYYIANKQRINKQNIEWAKANSERKKAADKKWVKANPEKVRQAQKNNYLKHPEKVAINRHKRRSRMQGVESKLIRRKDIKRILSKPCLYCGAKSTQLDHIIPVSRNGRNSIGNLVGACSPCNSSKNDKTIMEWRVWKLRQNNA